MRTYKVEDLGQVFTPSNMVSDMINLIKNGKNVLEPSCGDGAFYKELKKRNFNVTGIEFDSVHCPEDAINMDFFDFIDGEFDTIVGNPPYVSGKKIIKETMDKINSKLITHGKSNLYLYSYRLLIGKNSIYYNKKLAKLGIITRKDPPKELIEH